MRDTTLAKLAQTSFSGLPKLFASQSQLQACVPRLLSAYRRTPVTLQDFLSEAKGTGGFWFATHETDLVGLLRLDARRTQWKLSSFVVDSSQQGKGYGEAMLRQVTSAVPDRICLQVLQDNPAQKLYQRHGFETHDIRDGRLLMELR